MWKFLLAWFLMIPIAIVNGLFREKVLANRLTELRAHQWSAVSLILFFGTYVWVLFIFWPPESLRQSVHIGLLWLVLTIVFEFVFGHYIAGHSWNRLLQDYNMLKGRLWILVLIWITSAPVLIYQLQK